MSSLEALVVFSCQATRNPAEDHRCRSLPSPSHASEVPVDSYLDGFRTGSAGKGLGSWGYNRYNMPIYRLYVRERTHLLTIY